MHYCPEYHFGWCCFIVRWTPWDISIAVAAKTEPAMMEEALNSVTAHPAADVDCLDHLASDNLDIDLTLSACEYERQGQL